MFYRFNLLIIRRICLCCIAENINVNENIFVEKLYSNYLYLYISLIPQHFDLTLFISS